MSKGILSGLLDDIKDNAVKIDETENDLLNDNELKLVSSDKIKSFNYTMIDKETAEFLRHKEIKIIQIRTMSAFLIGKELKDTFDKLSKVPYGSKTDIFNSWVESIGMSSRHARRHIDAYNYVLKKIPNIEDAENIQTSLLFEISKPSAPLELQEAVISGDITTHKEYKELERKLKKVEKEAKDNAGVYNQLEKKYLENRDKYKELEEELENANQKVKEFKNVGNDEIATAVIEKIPNEIEEELEELRKQNKEINDNKEINLLLKIIVNNLNHLIAEIFLLSTKEVYCLDLDSKHALKEINAGYNKLNNLLIEKFNISI